MSISAIAIRSRNMLEEPSDFGSSVTFLPLSLTTVYPTELSGSSAGFSSTAGSGSFSSKTGVSSEISSAASAS